MAPGVNTDSASRITRAVDRNTNTILRRVPLWSLGIGFILVIILTGVWVLKDSLIAINSNAEKIKAMEADIAHCREMGMARAAEIAWLREENATLKQRVSSLEQITARTKMP